MRAEFDPEENKILITCSDREEFLKFFQLAALVEGEGVNVLADNRELNVPQLETRPGEVLVLTWSPATFASIKLADLKAGKVIDVIPDNHISNPLVNAGPVNRWWKKNKDGIVQKWLVNKGEIPHKKTGFLGGIFEIKK